jgi:hypothetical protein
MPFYGERKRRADRDVAESAGADLWTDSLESSVRYKILYEVGGLGKAFRVPNEC